MRQQVADIKFLTKPTEKLAGLCKAAVVSDSTAYGVGRSTGFVLVVFTILWVNEKYHYVTADKS